MTKTEMKDHARKFMNYYNRLVTFAVERIDKIDEKAANTIDSLRRQLNVYCGACSWGSSHVTEVAGPKLLENQKIIRDHDEVGFLNMKINKSYSHECPDDLKYVFDLETAIKRGFKISNTEERETAFMYVENMLDAYLAYLIADKKKAAHK